jgi:sarcosine oxidase, subunit gamma
VARSHPTGEQMRRSPLAHLAGEGAGSEGAAVAIAERPFLTKVNLRGDPDDPDFRDAVEGALGCALPREPNTTATAGDVTVLWLGPDEWLVVAPANQEDERVGALGAALRLRVAAVTDVSEGRTVVRIGGPRARDVLAKGCGLDLHPRAFAPGRCAQTGFARTHVILHQVDATPTYDLYVERSFAEYLWLWLADAAAEYRAA